MVTVPDSCPAAALVGAVKKLMVVLVTGTVVPWVNRNCGASPTPAPMPAVLRTPDPAVSAYWFVVKLAPPSPEAAIMTRLTAAGLLFCGSVKLMFQPTYRPLGTAPAVPAATTAPVVGLIETAIVSVWVAPVVGSVNDGPLAAVAGRFVSTATVGL